MLTIIAYLILTLVTSNRLPKFIVSCIVSNEELYETIINYELKRIWEATVLF